METTFQLNIALADKEQIKHSWAFAIDQRNSTKAKVRRSLADYKSCFITACSKEAKALGIRAGMRYEEAKLRLPELKILVIGDR
jgi:nucleotidyltransferase/DNA polymerase involved in DNA repair